MWFTTKGDNRVWELDVAAAPNTIQVVYGDDTSPNPVLTGVDNIVGSASGDLFVAEDGGNMELVMIEPDGAVSVLVRVLDQSGSEIAGPAFSPDNARLYFSSQRALNGAITYEVTGPFRTSVPPPTTTTTAPATTTTAPPATITLSAAGHGRSQALRRPHLVRRHDLPGRGVPQRRPPYHDRQRRRPHGQPQPPAGTFRYRVTHPGGTPTSDEATVTF